MQKAEGIGSWSGISGLSRIYQQMRISQSYWHGSWAGKTICRLFSMICWTNDFNCGYRIQTGLHPSYPGDPFLRTRYLIWENLLSIYPENHIPEWLQSNGIWGVLSQFTTRKRYASCIPFSLDAQLPPAIANFVRAFLIETWEKCSPMDSLSYLSGRLDVEIAFLLERLHLQLQQGESIQQVFQQAHGSI